MLRAMTARPVLPAKQSGTFLIGGDLPVRRLGFGAMRLTRPGGWGQPRDHAEAIAGLRRAGGLGLDLIDTAHPYRPQGSGPPDAGALPPYPARRVVATKARLER